ncbi:MAG: hypothetical protein AAGJ18_21370, partial [Bacteroidota bacterium]
MSNLKNENTGGNTGMKVAIAALALFLMAALGGVYHFSNESDTYANKTVQLNSELTALNEEKVGLESEIGELTATYEAETIKNTELEAKIVEAEEKVKGLKWRISKIKKELAETKVSNEEMQ